MSILEDMQNNLNAFEAMQPNLEKEHWGNWVVFTNGELTVIAGTQDEAVQKADALANGELSRLIRQIDEELPEVVRKL